MKSILFDRIQGLKTVEQEVHPVDPFVSMPMPTVPCLIVNAVYFGLPALL